MKNHSDAAAPRWMPAGFMKSEQGRKPGNFSGVLAMAAGDIALKMQSDWAERQKRWHCRISKVTPKRTHYFRQNGRWFEIVNSLDWMRQNGLLTPPIAASPTP